MNISHGTSPTHEERLINRVENPVVNALERFALTGNAFVDTLESFAIKGRASVDACKGVALGGKAFLDALGKPWAWEAVGTSSGASGMP